MVQAPEMREDSTVCLHPVFHLIPDSEVKDNIIMYCEKRDFLNAQLLISQFDGRIRNWFTRWALEQEAMYYLRRY